MRLCITLDLVSTRMGRNEWDQVRIRRWRREDEPRRAIWILEMDDGLLWIAPRGGVVDIAHADGWSMTMKPTEFGDDSHLRVSELPMLESVCEAALACEKEALRILGAQRPALGPVEHEIDVPPIELPERGVTLLACRTQRDEITALLHRRGVVTIPPACEAPLGHGR